MRFRPRLLGPISGVAESRTRLGRRSRGFLVHRSSRANADTGAILPGVEALSMDAFVTRLNAG